MKLWIKWWTLIHELRPVFSRTRTFLWFVAFVAGITIRTDLLGVTSIIRALGLQEKCYNYLIDSLHGNAIKIDKMVALWTKIVLRHFPGIQKVNGRIVLVGDGIKIPKQGKKMPAVKLLHQQSESNTKPEYIMGHSFQSVAILVSAFKSVFAVPISSRIHEGVKFSNRDKRTLLDKMIDLIFSLEISQPYYFVADAYYASQKVVCRLITKGNHLVTQVRKNAVAYLSPTLPKKRKPGRPKKYGARMSLVSLFSMTKLMKTVDSPVYGEKNVKIKYVSRDLLWRPTGSLVRFVAVVHPNRGKCILMSTDLALDPAEIIRLYGLRFKIEVSFKQAVRTIGSYAYHFWMKDMKPLRRRQGNQHLHRESKHYREQVIRKIRAYTIFVSGGIIAQGLLQYLSVSCSELVWSSFGSWIRTIRPGIAPSEMVTAMALRQTFPQFLLSGGKHSIMTKFITDRLDLNRLEGARLAS